jgi:hypothetical protein
MRQPGSEEREEAMQRPVCLLPLATCYSRKMGFEDVERDRPDTTCTNLFAPSSFTQLLSTLSFTSKG